MRDYSRDIKESCDFRDFWFICDVYDYRDCEG